MTLTMSSPGAARTPVPRGWALVAEFLVIALGYAAACLIFARPTLPLVFTSVIWIPAGLAFGAVYLRGYRVAPALFVGAVLGLVTRAVEIDGTTPPGVTPGEAWTAIVLEAIIVVGHSVLGTYLARRFVRDDFLATMRGAGSFLLLTGPVACLVGSVLGPPAMLLRSISDADGIWSVAFGFFVGDSTGVLLLAPIVAALGGSRDAWRDRLQPIVVVSIAMIFALFALHALVFRSEGDRVERAFAALNDRYVEAASSDVARADRDLHRIDDLLRADPTLEESDTGFDRAAARIERRLGGIAGVQVLVPSDGSWRVARTTGRSPEIDLDAANAAIVAARTVSRDVSGTERDRVVAIHRPVFTSDVAPSNTVERRSAAIGIVRVLIEPAAILRRESDGAAFRDAGVAIGELVPLGDDPDRWYPQNEAAGRFVVDGQVQPETILREHRAASVQRLDLAIGDQVVPITAAPSVGYLRNQTFLLASMPLAIASMLLAFTVGTSSLMLTGRAVRLAQLVTERTEALTRNERRYRTVVDSVAEVIFRADRDGRLQFVNHAWFDVVSSDDPFAAEGRPLQSFVATDDRAELADAIARTPDEPGVVEVVEARLDRDPDRWIELRMRHDGVEDAIVGTIVDVTLRRQVETARDQFVSMVSHEFRTPVTVISGSIDTIVHHEGDQLPPFASRLLPAMRSSSRRLLRLVEDLLFTARVDSGTLRFERRPVDVRDIVRASTDAAAADARSAAIEVDVDVPPDPVTVMGDPDRLGQLVDNLLSNALKYSPTGGTVEVAVARDGADVVVDVRDHGIGIAPADQERLFDRFWRSSDGARTAGGTGLGLAICRQIAEAHGGSVSVESTPGAGSTFRVRVPADQA